MKDFKYKFYSHFSISEVAIARDSYNCIGRGYKLQFS